MPQRRVARRKPMRRGRNMKGSGLWSWIKKAHNYVKSNKLISRAGSALSFIPGFGTAGAVAGLLGYGKRRGARRIKGGAINLAGAGCRRRCR